MLAATEGRLPLLGVLYDEIARLVGTVQGRGGVVSWRSACRKEWENAASARGAAFKIADVVGTPREDILRRARSLHDTLFGAIGGTSWKRGTEAGCLANLPGGMGNHAVSTGQGSV